MAAAIGNKEICSLLIEKGADIESADHEGKTPLMNAVNNKNHVVAGLLLAAGADINAKETNGWTTLMFASHGM